MTRIMLLHRVYAPNANQRLARVQVFPSIYLPIMTEANLRVLQPWRCYLPVLPAWWAFSSRMRRLNTCARQVQARSTASAESGPSAPLGI